MESKGTNSTEIFEELKLYGEKDVPYARVLSSMCTVPHPVAVRAHNDFIVSNLGDPKLFPGAAAIERKCIDMLGGLLHLKEAAGYITTGGTESNLQAMRTAIRYREARDGKPLDRARANIIVPDSAHYSFEKASQLLGVSIRRAPLDEEMKADAGSIKELVDDHTIALVAIAGTTEFGQVDPIPEIAKIAIADDIYLHVDAAFGGFVIPFLKNASKLKYDFEIPGVMSVTIDPHKMGLSTIPSGGILYRNEAVMKLLEIHAQYLTSFVQSSLAGTRTGSSAAATYAVMRYLGREGYEAVVSRCMDDTYFLYDKLKRIGLEPALDPVMNIVTFKMDDPVKVRKRLCDRQWYISTTGQPRALRMVVMPHVTESVIEGFIKDLKDVL